MRTMIKSLAVTTASAALVLGGAGLASASADTGQDGDQQGDQTSTRVDENRVEDSGNISLDDLIDGRLGDVASNNNVASGNDTDTSDNLNGNDADASDNLSGNESNSSSDRSEDGGQDNEESLLGGLL